MPTLDSMVHSLLAVVLALLMLMPPGICVCGGGSRPCPDHPTPENALEPPESLPGGGDDPCCGAVRVGNTRVEHHCPDPLPHEPLCPVVTTTSIQAVAEIAPVVTIDWFVEPVVVRLAFVPAPRPLAPTPIHVPTLPRFIAHCALLI